MTGDLFGWRPPEVERPKTIDERFAEFHAANPHVAEEMLRLARARLERGERRIGAKALWEELRGSLSTTDPEYSLNNTYTALYARLLLELEPRLINVIEVRRRKGER